MFEKYESLKDKVKEELFEAYSTTNHDIYMDIEDYLVDQGVSTQAFINAINIDRLEEDELIKTALSLCLKEDFDYHVSGNGTIIISVKSIYEDVESSLMQEEGESDDSFFNRCVEETNILLEEYENSLNNYFSVDYSDTEIEKVETKSLLCK